MGIPPSCRGRDCLARQTGSPPACASPARISLAFTTEDRPFAMSKRSVARSLCGRGGFGSTRHKLAVRVASRVKGGGTPRKVKGESVFVSCLEPLTKPPLVTLSVAKGLGFTRNREILRFAQNDRTRIRAVLLGI